jgi:hypothetical protein
MSADLERAIGALEREDLGVTVLEAAEYPGLEWLEGTVVVAVGPFGSAEEARAACPDLGIPATSCVARQPGSPR